MGSAKELNGAAEKVGSSVHKRKSEDDGYRHDDRRKKVKGVDEKVDRRSKDVVEKEREKVRDKSEKDRERREKERSSRDKDKDTEKGKERSSRDKTRDTEKERDKDRERSHGNGAHSRTRDHDRRSDKERDRESTRIREMDPRAEEREKASDKDRENVEKGVLETDEAKRNLEGHTQMSSTFQGSEVTETVNSLPQANTKANNIEDANLNEEGNATLNTKGSNLTTPSAVAKARRALEMQKLLSEKIKKLPQVNRTMTQMSTGSSSVSTSMSSSLAVSSTVSSISAGPTVAQLPHSSDAPLAASRPINSNLLNPGFNFLPDMMPNFSRLIPGMASVANYETLMRVQEVAARLGIQQGPDSLPFLAVPSGQVPDSFGTSGQQKGVKGPVLRLDAQGREIDEHGNILEKTKVSDLSTLKVNINKQKKDSFQILHPELEDDPVCNPFFDPNMGIDKKKLLRPKRPFFQFVEEGKWSKQAEMIRLKSQFGEAQAKEIKTKQAALAKARAEADINPNLIEVSERFPVKEEKPKYAIPDIEWWDAVLLPSGSYGDENDGDLKVKMEKLTIYVEHPVPIEPPAEPTPPPPQPLKLTKKEQKKLRTQRRLAKEKDRQEMIRQGLLEPPKPKVKMSNLMKVLGAEATQDPTKLEMEIRTAAAEREQAHTDRNLARKLTPAERRDKKERKLFDDPNTLETFVSVYKINNISNPQIRFKVDINAQENRLTGCLLMCDTMNVVIVEGGSKPIKRYAKLMLQRIKWATVVKEDEEGDHEGTLQVNKCSLIWQGSVAKPGFEKFLIQQCRTEAAARKFLADSGVGHYWDLAANFVEE